MSLQPPDSGQSNPHNFCSPVESRPTTETSEDHTEEAVGRHRELVRHTLTLVPSVSVSQALTPKVQPTQEGIRWPIRSQRNCGWAE
jgi:hypothetical protein